jgi:hypothetical protein
LPDIGTHPVSANAEIPAIEMAPRTRTGRINFFIERNKK